MGIVSGAGGSPTGTAGGGLGGTYPNPDVEAIESVIVSDVAPSAGQVLTATGATAAGWAATVASLAKSGSTGLTGAVTLSGGSNVTLTQAGQDISVAASGGGAVTTHEACDGNAISINNSASAALTWDATSGPNTLLDRTSPDAPVVLASGVYAVMVVTQPQAGLTAAGWYELRLTLSTGAGSLTVYTTQERGTALGTPEACLAAIWYIPVGNPISVRVDNEDGVAARSFGLDAAYVQRLA